MRSLQVSAILAIVAAVAIIAGVVILAGVGWGLIAGGVLALAAAVVLYDPAPKKP